MNDKRRKQLELELMFYELFENSDEQLDTYDDVVDLCNVLIGMINNACDEYINENNLRDCRREKYYIK